MLLMSLNKDNFCPFKIAKISPSMTIFSCGSRGTSTKYEYSLVGLPTGCQSSHSMAPSLIFFVQIEQTRTFVTLASDGIIFFNNSL